MNNNDFYGNLDRIRKLYLKQNYDDAIKIADKMDFKRLKDWKYIAMLINLYEAVGRLEDVKYFCILAYNRNLGGKKLVFKLTKVMIRLEEIDEAEELYEEYMQMPGRDNKKYELQYELKAIQGAKPIELIKILEEYMKRELDEKYAYTLADLYARTKQKEKCANFCDRIIERFEGNAVADKAMALKKAVMQGAAVPSGVAQTAKNASANAQQAQVRQNMAQTPQQNVAANQMQQDMYVTGNIEIQDLYATQGIPVQDMYATGNIPMQDMYATGNIPVQDMYATGNIPMQDMYATGNIPVQDMYATGNIPVQDMYATGDIPMQDMYATGNIPVQDMYATGDIPMQDMYATGNIPVQNTIEEEAATAESDLGQTVEIPAIPQVAEAPVMPETEEVEEQPEEVANEEAESENITDVTGVAVQQELPLDEMSAEVKETVSGISPEEAAVLEETAAEVAEAVADAMVEEAPEDTIKESVEAELEAANPFVVHREDGITEETTEISLPIMTAPGNTVRVDTEAVNAAIMEATAAMKVPGEPHIESSNLESTMAMVEAALANETQAAQFEARMDMPEYTEEYAAPVKDKVTLRAFQPEIDRVYEIPMEVKRYFTKYSTVTGLEAKIGEYFESTKYEDKMGTSAIGNIIISGNRSSDKTTLAINIVKALNLLYPDKTRKIARTTGDNINQRGIERSIGKLLGSALIIEEAGVMDRQRILELCEVMESDTQELLIVLEDSESEINELLKNNPELIEKFNHRITFKQFTVNELVEMCKRYADKCHYAIDEKALLQLYLRIDDIHSNGDGVSLEDVRDVVDTAIENAQRRANKKIFGGAKKKRVGDKDYVVLVESDFKE